MARLFKNVQPQSTGVKKRAADPHEQAGSGALTAMIEKATIDCGDDPRAIASQFLSMYEVLASDEKQALSNLFMMVLSGGRESSRGRSH